MFYLYDVLLIEALRFKDSLDRENASKNVILNSVTKYITLVLVKVYKERT